MGVLAEYLKTEAEQLKAEKAKRRAVVREWVDSLNALYKQVQDWLAISDPENLIEKTVEQVPGRELSFGSHTVPVLRLTLVDRNVSFEPIARYMAAMVRTPGAAAPVRVDGGVQLRGLTRTCYLFRVGGQWYVQKEFENLWTAGNDVVPLDADRLEAVVRESL